MNRNNHRVAAVFAGDGRETIRLSREAADLLPERPGAMPVKSVTKRTASKYVENFKIRGVYYSATGGLLWLHELYCILSEVDYEVTGDSLHGWALKLKDLTS